MRQQDTGENQENRMCWELPLWKWEKGESLEHLWPRDQSKHFPPLLQDADEEESLGAGEERRMFSAVCNGHLALPWPPALQPFSCLGVRADFLSWFSPFQSRGNVCWWTRLRGSYGWVQSSSPYCRLMRALLSPKRIPAYICLPHFPVGKTDGFLVSVRFRSWTQGCDIKSRVGFHNLQGVFLEVFSLPLPLSLFVLSLSL